MKRKLKAPDYFRKWWVGNRWKAQQWYIDAVTEAAFYAGFRAGRRSKGG